MKKVFFIFCGLIPLSQTCYSQTGDSPAIIIIMADQLRFDVIGGLTPNIELLRKDGVSFNRTYCASPICVPSRASFYTGLYPNRSGSLINGWEDEDASYGRVRSGVANLYSLLENRWDSRHVGKQHFLTEDNIDGPGSATRWITQKDYGEWVKKRGAAKPGGKQFKAMVPEMVSGDRTHTRTYSVPVTALYEPGLENFLDHYIADECVKAIRNRSRTKPLFLNAMFLAPHPPFHIPAPYYSMFDETPVTIPENVGEWYPGQSPLQLYNLTGFLGARYSRTEWQEIWRKYLGLVRLLDDEVGRIVQALKEEGLYEKAIIVFTADHGEMLGSHSLWQKMCMYEESSRVPLIMKFPSDFTPVIRETEIATSLVDVFPTLLEYTGVEGPAELDGQSLLPAVSGKAYSPSPVFVQYDGNGSLGNFQRCVVAGDHKLIVDIFKDETFIELYNVIDDPQEKHNLAFDDGHAGKVKELVRVLRQHMDDTGDRLHLPPPADLCEKFLSRYKRIIE